MSAQVRDVLMLSVINMAGLARSQHVHPVNRPGTVATAITEAAPTQVVSSRMCEESNTTVHANGSCCHATVIFTNDKVKLSK